MNSKDIRAFERAVSAEREQRRLAKAEEARAMWVAILSAMNVESVVFIVTEPSRVD